MGQGWAPNETRSPYPPKKKRQNFCIYKFCQSFIWSTRKVLNACWMLPPFPISSPGKCSRLACEQHCTFPLLPRPKLTGGTWMSSHCDYDGSPCLLKPLNATPQKIFEPPPSHYKFIEAPILPFWAEASQFMEKFSEQLNTESRFYKRRFDIRDFKICYGEALLRQQEVTFIPSIFTAHACVWVSGHSCIKTARRS